MKESKKIEEISSEVNHFLNINCVDMLGRNVQIKQPIKKIVSLVPSQTEFLYALGLEDKIAGQTIFCVHPKSAFKKSYKVGGTKKIKFDKIKSIQPDLIICNKEENTNDMVEQLSLEHPVWVSDIKSLDDAYQMMNSLAYIFSTEIECYQIIESIKEQFASIKIYHRYNTLYLIWRKPFMAAGRDTFINEMMIKSGFNNSIQSNRYPELDAEALRHLNPEVILLSSEPYPFSEQHILELKEILPQSKIILVDGEMFSWYGNRLLYAPSYFNELQRQLHKLKR